MAKGNEEGREKTVINQDFRLNKKRNGDNIFSE